MKFKKIVCIGIAESKLQPQYWSRIDKLAENRVMLQTECQDIKEQLCDADCLLINPFAFKADKSIIDMAQKLQYIGVLATSYGAVDCICAAKKSIIVCNIPDYSTESVAEVALAVILECIRDIEHAKQRASASDYSDVPRVPVYEIKDKKVGIIGLGRIGGRIAELALAFGAKVSYWSKNRKRDAESKGIQHKEIETLLSESDFISINLALNKETEGLMNATRLNKIKHGAILINLAPNELIDFIALEKKLAQSDITYIADHTDEMSGELLKTLSKYKNCILYPPIGYQTKEATMLKQEIFVGNIEKFLKGNPVNKVAP